MIINWVGEFNKGYVGEIGDSNHLVRELRSLGHIVRAVPQDMWKGFVDGEAVQKDWILPIQSDINIITKWHHFDNGKYINRLRHITKAPVFYWVWDYMQDGKMPPFHHEMCFTADLYLGNDVKNSWYKERGINSYYFPFDVADGDFIGIQTPEFHKKFDVVFFGSHLRQGDRVPWIKEIDKTNPVTIFSWNFEEWRKEGLDAHPAVYGQDFVNKVSQSKVILGFSVEPDCWGYWSNRVGKILTLGGFLLYQYAPGMELFLRDGVEYFSSIKEAQEKIDQYLIDVDGREKIAQRGWQIGRDKFTSSERIKELIILMERFIKTRGRGWKL